MTVQPGTSGVIRPGTIDPLPGSFGPKPGHFPRLWPSRGTDSPVVVQCDCCINSFSSFQYSAHMFSLVTSKNFCFCLQRPFKL